MSADPKIATASMMKMGLDIKIKEETDQIKPKPDLPSIDDIALTLNQNPYSITCRPTQGLPISKDDSNTIDIYAYTLKKLEENSLLIDTIDYFIATQGKVRERRISLLIPDEKGIPAAYVFDLMEPNYIAINLLKHIFQALSLKPGMDINSFLTQHKQMDDQTKKILQSLSASFLKSNKDMLSFMLSDKSIQNCFAGLYNTVDFKYMGSVAITSQNKEMSALTLSKISKSKPLNPTYSEPRSQNIFYKTLAERIICTLTFGNEDIEKFCLDEFYHCTASLKEQTPILNKLLYIQKSDKILHHLTSNPSLSNYDSDKMFNPMSFAFKKQFLSIRKNPAKFLEWVDNTFKTHIKKLENLITQFTKEFKVTNQNDHEIIQKVKRVMALFPILNSKSTQLFVRPAFYLDFLHCKADLSKINIFLKETIKTIQPYIKNDFLAFFDSEQVLNLTSNEYLISEATVDFIRYQIIAQLRNDHYGLKIDVTDIDSLKLLLRTDTHIGKLLTSASEKKLLEQYLKNMELDFMQEFLIQSDRLSWLNKMNFELYLESLKLKNELSSQIQKMEESTSYQQRISSIFSKAYNLTLPGIGSRLFSHVSNAYYNSEWLSLWKKFRFSEDFEFNLWALRPPLYVMNQTGKLLDKTSKYVTDVFKTSRSYVLGLGVGLYAADPYQQLYFIGAHLLFQKTYEYLSQPTLEQLLKKYDSATIVKSFEPNAKPFLTYYESLNKNDSRQGSSVSATAAATATATADASASTSSTENTIKTTADNGSAGKGSNGQIVSGLNAAGVDAAAATTNSDSANSNDNKNVQVSYKL